MTLLEHDIERLSFECPVCHKTMATPGGFNIHMTDGHPEVATAAIPARTSERAPLAGVGGQPATPADDPLLEATSLASSGMGPRSWRLAVIVEVAGLPVDDLLAARLQQRLLDPTASVSAAGAGSEIPSGLLIESSIHADGVLTAVLHGIEHVQAALHAMGIDDLNVVQLYVKTVRP